MVVPNPFILVRGSLGLPRWRPRRAWSSPPDHRTRPLPGQPTPPTHTPRRSRRARAGIMLPTPPTNVVSARAVPLHPNCAWQLQPVRQVRAGQPGVSFRNQSRLLSNAHAPGLPGAYHALGPPRRAESTDRAPLARQAAMGVPASLPLPLHAHPRSSDRRTPHPTAHHPPPQGAPRHARASLVLPIGARAVPPFVHNVTC